MKAARNTMISALVAVAALLASLVEADRLHFGVVAFPRESVDIIIDGVSTTNLAAPDPNEPYYGGIIEAQAGTKYKYVVDGQTEAFDRVVTAEHVRNGRTHNDFFGRQATVQRLPKLSWPFDDQWKRSLGLTPMFDDSYILTINLSGDRAAIQNMWTTMVNTTVPVRMTVITADYIIATDNVLYGISAAGRKMNYAKQAYRLKMPTGFHLFGRDEWKLRNTEEDPLQIREKTYMNMLNAAGVPVMQGNNVRLYVNKEPVGTYIINDDGDQKSFVRALFHGPATPLPKGAPVGTLLQGDFLDFVYKGDDPALYSSVKAGEIGPNPVSNPLQSLISFLRFLDASGTDDASIDALGERFDIESFLRAMAFEFLTVHWDGYWEQGTNFLLYEDPITNKWFFLDQDFDMTMGCASTASGYSILNVTNLSVNQYGGNAKGQQRPILTKIIAAPKYKARFDAIIKAIVQHLFNPAVLGARVKANAARIREEVVWDRSQTRRHVGRPDNWKVLDFDTNLNAEVNVPLASCEFGLVQWIERRSAAVAAQFAVQPDTTPRPVPDPITTAPGNLPTGSINDIVKVVRSSASATSPFALVSLLGVVMTTVFGFLEV